jgi:hypothetical protein
MPGGFSLRLLFGRIVGKKGRYRQPGGFQMRPEPGADAMLYSSRSRPDLPHVVVFRPECLNSFGGAAYFLVG